MNMTAKKTSAFYLKIFTYGLLIGLCIWLPRIFSFFWGNHDWSYVKSGILIDDGLFEARYSQYLPMIMFFDGQILPILSLFLTICFLVVMAIFIAKYLDVPKNTVSYLFLTAIVVTLPHIAILFYFVHYMFSLAFWGCFGVLLLFLSEEKFKLWKFICGALGLTILLGSYPPILALLGVLFVGKRIILYINQKQDFKHLLKNALFCGGQLIVAVLFYKLILVYLTHLGKVNTKMYNLSVYGVWDILRQIPVEFVASLKFLADLQRFFDNIYGLFFLTLLVFGAGLIIYKAKNKIMAVGLIAILLLVSRLPFILTSSSYIAYFRVCLWGELGLIVVFSTIILVQNRQCIRNISWVLGIFLLCYFARVDLEMQKVQQLGFYSERLFHKRVEERLFSYPLFNLRNQYVTLNFGYPKFQHHFCYNNCRGFNNDVLDKTVLEAYFGQIIFWDEMIQPTITKLGVWGGIVYVVDSLVKKISVQSDNIQSLRYWSYMSAEEYPSAKSFYINDNLLFFIFDKSFFNKNREIVLNYLQSKQK